MNSNTKSHLESEALIGLLKLKRDNEHLIVDQSMYKYKSVYQRNVLSQVYRITSHPSSITRSDLGILLNMNPRSIQIWFQNIRQSIRASTSDTSQAIKKPRSKETSVPVTILINICIDASRRA